MRAIFIIVISSFILLISSCSDEHDLILPEKSVALQKCVMRFNSSKPHFDDEYSECNGRAYSNDWNNNDTLYIYFPNDNATDVLCSARAVYRSETDLWEVEMVGSLNTNGKCIIYHLQGGEYSSRWIWEIADFPLHVSIGSPHTAIYGGEGVYEYSNGRLSIVASLKPLTSRVRFVSKSAQNIKIKGIERYGSFSDSSILPRSSQCKLDEFQPFIVSIDKLENGMYTSDYVYGKITDVYKMLQILDLSSPDKFYQRNFQGDNDFMAIGKSGLIEIPTRSNYSGWEIRNNFIKDIADYIDVTESNSEYSYTFDENIVGYCIRFEADMELMSTFDTYNGAIRIAMEFIGSSYGGTVICGFEPGTYPFLITYLYDTFTSGSFYNVNIYNYESYSSDYKGSAITFYNQLKANYPADKAIFRNVKLYHFSY